MALISYISIIYSFIVDRVIFHEEFSWVELVAALVILLITVVTSIYKLRESSAAKKRRADSFTSAEDVNRSMVKLD